MESDSDLVHRVRSGEKDAFETLIARYERSVRSIALAYLADHHSAEDAAQDSFVTAFRTLQSLREPDKFGPWLMQIARRVSGRFVRGRGFIPVTVPDAGRIAVPANPERPLHQHLLALLERLPEQERLVVTMRYFDGHSTKEIADITSRPLGTVTKQLSRAYERLRGWYARSEEADL
ncbi:MAG: sigma-70 family RNA polymerase sigma factor [Isosphaeraceae bacterium]|nr:sigma-70 family RNA polymerase sigma factor [Isosphaeraceae bacterium]